jgi:hypothetical protein
LLIFAIERLPMATNTWSAGTFRHAAPSPAAAGTVELAEGMDALDAGHAMRLEHDLDRASSRSTPLMPSLFSSS